MKELKAPPADPVPWTVGLTNTLGEGKVFESVTVLSRTWFDARDQGARLLGVSPEQVVALEGAKPQESAPKANKDVPCPDCGGRGCITCSGEGKVDPIRFTTHPIPSRVPCSSCGPGSSNNLSKETDMEEKEKFEGAMKAEADVSDIDLYPGEFIRVYLHDKTDDPVCVRLQITGKHKAQMLIDPFHTSRLEQLEWKDD